MIIRIVDYKGNEYYVEIRKRDIMLCRDVAMRNPSDIRGEIFENCLVDNIVETMVRDWISTRTYIELLAEDREKARKAVQKYREKMEQLVRNWIRSAILQIIQERGGI